MSHLSKEELADLDRQSVRAMRAEMERTTPTLGKAYCDGVVIAVLQGVGLRETAKEFESANRVAREARYRDEYMPAKHNANRGLAGAINSEGA